jgi:hypothetical protein
MQEIENLVLEFAKSAPIFLLVLTSLGSLVVVGQAVVVITPSKKDDEILDKIEKHSISGFFINLLKRFAVIQKK